jgi:hypothetical protein
LRPIGHCATGDFSDLADLASRRFSGAVMEANDELLAEKASLNPPGPPRHDAAFGIRQHAVEPFCPSG